MKSKKFFIGVFLVCLCIPQCKEDDKGKDDLIRTITITGDLGTMVIGEEVTVTATVTPSNATEAIEWKTTSNGVVTVTSNGALTAVVKAVATGTTEIYAVSAAGKNSNFIEANVGEEGAYAITAITIPSSLELVVDEQTTVTATVQPNNSPEAVKWVIKEGDDIVSVTAGSDGRSATVASKGPQGQATIVATNQDGSVESDELIVTVTAEPDYLDYSMPLNPDGWTNEVQITDLGEGVIRIVSQGGNPFLESHGIGTIVSEGAIKKQIIFEYRNNKASHSMRFLWSFNDLWYDKHSQNKIQVPHSEDWTEIVIDVTSPDYFTAGFGTAESDQFRFDPIDGNGETDKIAKDECPDNPDDCWEAHLDEGNAYCNGYQIDIRNLRLRVVLK